MVALKEVSGTLASPNHHFSMTLSLFATGAKMVSFDVTDDIQILEGNWKYSDVIQIKDF